MKTSNLTGAALDWAVLFARNPSVARLFSVTHCLPAPFSTEWAIGGPIIEEQCIDLYQSGIWSAEIVKGTDVIHAEGPTPLIAAMRCYVASRLGAEVDVPEELMEV